jgi:hypothetical protein
MWGKKDGRALAQQLLFLIAEEVQGSVVDASD